MEGLDAGKILNYNESKFPNIRKLDSEINIPGGMDMDRIRRNERLAAMTRILVDSPNKIFTLGTFCEMFGAAKSTLSEDIDILRGVFAQFHLGQLDTVTGAAGGVRFRPVLSPEDAYKAVRDLAQMLSLPGRILPGGFI